MTEFTSLDTLTILYFYSSSFHAYMLRLEEDFFPEEHQLFFELMQKYYKSYNKVPPKSALLLEVEDNEKGELDRLYDSVVTNLDQVKHYAHDYIIEKFDAFAKRNYLKRFLLNSYDQFEQQNYEDIIESISSLRECIIDNDLGQEYHDYDNIEKRYASDNESTIAIPSGFSQFDETFDGWHKRSLNVIAGPANSGKTMWLINCVVNRLLDQTHINNKILYITLEIDENEVAKRLDMCLSGLTTKALRQDQSNLAHMLMQIKNSRELGNCVKIKDMPGYKTTTGDIEACIRNLAVQEDGFTPSLVIIDYLGLLAPTTKSKNMSMYEKGLYISVELRELAKQFDIPIIVAAQTNRNSFQDRPGMDNISDSIGISQTSDLMLMINRNETLDQNNQVEIFLAKSRLSKNNLKYIFSVDYDTMKVRDIILDAGEINDSF